MRCEARSACIAATDCCGALMLHAKFVASAFLWAFSLLHALTSDHSETIHV